MTEFVPYIALLISLASFWLSYRAYIRSGAQERRGAVLKLASHLSTLHTAWQAAESELTFLRDAADAAARNGRNADDLRQWVQQVMELIMTSKERVSQMHDTLLRDPNKVSQDEIDRVTMMIERTSKSMSELTPVLRRKLESIHELVGTAPQQNG